MNTYQRWIVLIAVLMAAVVGYSLGTFRAPEPGTEAMRSGAGGGDGPCEGAPAEYWVAPMDASYRRDGPGKSPMGMDLVPVCGGGSGQSVDVQIEPAVVQHLGIRKAVVRRERLAPTIRASGVVALDADSLNMVHSRAAGWLEQLGVSTVGERVQPGDLLFSLFSPDLLAAEREYLSARGHRALREAAADRLLALGYTRAQIAALARRGSARERSDRHAQAPWVVASLDARPGQFVTPGSMVMTLARLDRVWIYVDVPERQAARLRPGLAAAATVQAWPGRQWTGRVDLVMPEVNASTRTQRARLVFDNPDEQLVPGMFADVTLTPEPDASMLTVPTKAVIRTGQGDRVVRVAAPGRYDIVPVTTGLSTEGRTAVLEGLAAGDQVVISGQFLIDSEANLDAETLRLRARQRPAGRARAIVRDVNVADGTVRLEHGPLEPVGETGLSMPGMTMSFDLGAGLDPAAWSPGDRVEVRIEQQGAARYVITEIDARPVAAMDHGEMDHGEMDHGEMDHGEMDHGEMDHGEMDHGEMDHGEMDHGEMDHGEMDHGEMDHGEMDHGEMDHGEMDHGEMDHGEMDHGSGGSGSWTRAEVRSLHRGQRSVVLAHDMIHSIGMPPMTMGFSVAPAVNLEPIEQGMTVHIRVDMPSDGVYRVTAMEPLP